MTAEPSAKPRSIVLITADQHRGDTYGFRGRSVRTPHLDRLAREGTDLAAMITPNPVCQPARASILTGLLPLTHGVRDNGVDLPEETGAQGFAGILSNAGYDTKLIGKAHFTSRLPYEATSKPEDRTTEHESGWSGPYMGFEDVELCLSGDIDVAPYPPPIGQHYERWLYSQVDVDEYRERYAYDRDVPQTAPAQTWHSLLPVALHPSSWCADRAVRFIQNRDDDRPFFLWVSFPDPHHPFDCPEPWSRLHDRAHVDLPRYRELDLDRRPWWHRASLESTPKSDYGWANELRTRLSRIPEQSDEQLRDMTANYFGMVSLIDHGVGRILGQLTVSGLDRDTLVVYTSDHGEWLGDHGLVLKGPMLYEGLITVGAIMRGPGIPAAHTVTDPTSTMDLASTFLQFAGLDVPDYWHSQSVLGLLRGEDERLFAIGEWDVHPSRCGVELRLRYVRTKRHKLVYEELSHAGEMYDLLSDPHEMNNLFDDPSFAAVRSELFSLIEERPRDYSRTQLPAVGPS